MTTLTLPALALASTGIEDLVGDTPLIRLRRLTAHLPQTVEVYAKAEWANASGSVKARPALRIIREALDDGRLTPGKVLLDSTSGNMGIAYATFAAALGFAVELAMPANASPERLAVLKALGAALTLTDPTEGSDGAILAARELLEKRPDRYFYADQYNNPDNWLAHYHTTGPEIVAQTAGRVTHFVAGLGTSGTLVGAGRYLRERAPGITLVSFQPNSPFHGLEGLKHMPTAIVPGIYDPALADENLEVHTEEAHQMTRRLAREEGLFVGISSGAAALAALRVAEKIEYGVVVTVFPDSGYKYISEKFWDGEIVK